MTTKLFLEEYNATTILEQLLISEMHLPLFEMMKIDGPFRYEFARLYLQLQGKGYKMDKLQKIANQILSDEEVCLKLGNIGKYFPQKLGAYVRFAEKNEVSNLAGCLVETSRSTSLPDFISLITGCLKGKINILC